MLEMADNANCLLVYEYSHVPQIPAYRTPPCIVRRCIVDLGGAKKQEKKSRPIALGL